jgi:hypothetical protein
VLLVPGALTLATLAVKGVLGSIKSLQVCVHPLDGSSPERSLPNAPLHALSPCCPVDRTRADGVEDHGAEEAC